MQRGPTYSSLFGASQNDTHLSGCNGHKLYADVLDNVFWHPELSQCDVDVAAGALRTESPSSTKAHSIIVPFQSRHSQSKAFYKDEDFRFQYNCNTRRLLTPHLMVC